MSNCGEEEWERLFHLYINEKEPQEKVKLINALASVQEPWLLNRLIELAKDENNVRSQDFIFLLVSISDNPVGNPIVWDFVREQWPYLVKRFTLNDRILGRLVPSVTSNFSSQTKFKELKTFLNENPEGGAGVAGRKIAIEKVENNINWLTEHVDQLETSFLNC